MIFETRARQFAIDLDLASAELKRAVDQIQSIPRDRRRQKRPVITGTVPLDPARDNYFWKCLICQFQMRIRFVIFEKDVEPRAMLFEQVGLKNERFDFVVHNDKLKIRDHPHKLTCLWIVIAARLKIRSHAVSQIFRFPDVDYLSGSILMYVNAGISRQKF